MYAWRIILTLVPQETLGIVFIYLCTVAVVTIGFLQAYRFQNCLQYGDFGLQISESIL